jgi:hypothetical protein
MMLLRSWNGSEDTGNSKDAALEHFRDLTDMKALNRQGTDLARVLVDSKRQKGIEHQAFNFKLRRKAPSPKLRVDQTSTSTIDATVTE